MNILIINAGSSSIKFQLIKMPSQKVVCSGMVERIGAEDAMLSYAKDEFEVQVIDTIKTHSEGLQRITHHLLHPENGAVQNVREIDAVGHRVVHGGDSFASTTLINASVKAEIKEYATLAPLHNPHNLRGIEITEKLFPTARQIAVFDTAFHSSMPVEARKYAIPNAFYTTHGIQAYGFHGTSHKYVSERAMEYLKKERSMIISIHLGNGCSMTAIVDGKSVDHSLGFAPSNGLIMGSRSGDIDHAIIFHLVDTLGYSLEEVNGLLTKKSGMLGLTGYSDLRHIQKKAKEGNTDCQVALAMNAYRIKKYIGAYTAAMNGLDVLIFTAGVGENSAIIRQMVCSKMDYMGIELDKAKNEIKSKSLREINAETSKVKILVIPTNEELEIARQTFNLLT